jgi:hypothetical protein
MAAIANSITSQRRGIAIAATSAMDTLDPCTLEPRLAKPVAAEDLRRGDYFAILAETREYPSFYWCFDPALEPRDKPVRITWKTANCGTPWKVKAICLPFLFAMNPLGQTQTFDLRHFQVARVDAEYGKYVWKQVSKRSSGLASAPQA